MSHRQNPKSRAPLLSSEAFNPDPGCRAVGGASEFELRKCELRLTAAGPLDGCLPPRYSTTGCQRQSGATWAAVGWSLSAAESTLSYTAGDQTVSISKRMNAPAEAQKSSQILVSELLLPQYNAWTPAVEQMEKYACDGALVKASSSCRAVSVSGPTVAFQGHRSRFQQFPLRDLACRERYASGPAPIGFE